MASVINNTLQKSNVRGAVSPQNPMPMMGSMAPSIPPVVTAPLGALGNAVKSHTITVNPDGTQKHTIVHENGEKASVSGLVSPKATPKAAPQETQAPPIHYINDKHYVPFKTTGGKVAHINAEGHVIY